MCMNLEAGQVGIVLFGSDRLVKEGETVKRTGQIVRTVIWQTLYLADWARSMSLLARQCLAASLML
jgi:F0F1-type ATP synthase alpha subunit